MVTEIHDKQGNLVANCLRRHSICYFLLLFNFEFDLYFRARRKGGKGRSGIINIICVGLVKSLSSWFYVKKVTRVILTEVFLFDE